MGKKIALIVLAVAALLSCENPIQAGLGSKVDITAPTIAMVAPREIGGHIKGEFDFWINAGDDIGVTLVQMAVTIAPDGTPLDPANWIWVDATLDSVSGHWNYALDTTQYPDGDLPVWVKAQDKTGKETIFEGMYSVKNGPAEVELQIPAMIENPTNERHMELVTGGYMIGIAKDLWGVAPGYPKIQFRQDWDDSLAAAYAWQDMDGYASMSAEEWAASTGRTALEFRYNAVDRESGINLWPGYYRFRFKVRDVDGVEAIYPAEGSYQVEVVSAKELPIIALRSEDAGRNSLSGQYHRESFYIAADLSHTMGIYDATIEVQKEGAAAPVVLARGVFSENTETGSGSAKTQVRKLESFLIQPGEEYSHTDTASGMPMDAPYRFDDGVYNFTVKTTSIQTSTAQQTLTIYIDTTAPDITVTRVQPSEAPATAGGLAEYTVNGFVAAEISYYDANNVGTAADTGYREIRYLITDAYDAAADPVALYALAGEQRYFDNPQAPVYKQAGSSSSLVINTTDIDSQNYYGEKVKYLHFVAKDRAGNYGFTAVRLKVNQSKDIPTVSIPAFDLSQTSEALLSDAMLDPLRSANFLGNPPELSGTFTDDDGGFVAAAQPGSGAFTVTVYQDNASHVRQQKWTSTTGTLVPQADGRTATFTAPLPLVGDPDHLPDGIYSALVKVWDSADAKNQLKPQSVAALPSISNEEITASPHIYFALDTEPPSISNLTWSPNPAFVTADDIRVYGQSSYTFSFTAHDATALKNVVVTRNGTPLPSGVALAPPYPFPAGTKTVNVTVSQGLADLDYEYEIIVTDILDKKNVVNALSAFKVRVDTTGPVVTIAAPSHDLLVLSDTLLAVGNATDKTADGMNVWYKIDTSPTAALPADRWHPEASPDNWKPTVENWKAEATLDTHDEGYQYIHVIAYDKLGNCSAATDAAIKTERFVLDTSPPTIVGFNPGTSKTFADDPVIYATSNDPINTTTVAYGFTFTASDTNALSDVVVTRTRGQTSLPLTSSEIEFVPPKVMTGTPPKEQFPAGTKTVSVTVSLEGQSEGNYAYVIDITDIAGKHNVLDNSTDGDTTDDHREFIVRADITGPVLTVESPADNLRLPGSTVNVNGSATDLTTNGLTVWYKVDTVDASGTSAPAKADALAAGWEEAPGGTTWIKNDISLLALGEGERYVHIVGFDKLDHASAAVTSRKVLYDAAPPYIEGWDTTNVEKIGESYYARGAYELGFTAKDSNALAGITVTRGSAILQEGTHTEYGGYTLDIDRSDATNRSWPVKLTLADPPEGTVSYVFEIRDVLDKPNTPDNQPGSDAADQNKKNITVRVDKTGPSLAVTAPSLDIPPVIDGSTLQVRGNAIDFGIPDGVQVFYFIDTNSTVATYPTLANAATSGWTSITPAEFAAGKNITLAYPLYEEGGYWVHFIAYDQLGNPSNPSPPADRQYFVDHYAPQINNWSSSVVTEKTPTVNLTKSGTYSFSFDAVDTNGVKDVRIYRPASSNTELSAGVNKGGSPGDPSRHITVNVNGQADGDYTYRIEIEDSAGKINPALNVNDGTPDGTEDGTAGNAFKTFNVRVDTTGPALTITYPKNNPLVRDTRLIAFGTATDATMEGLEVWYLVDTNDAFAASAPSNPSYPEADGWALATNNWDAEVNFGTQQPEGILYFHAIAYDSLGNVSSLLTEQFSIDNSPPKILGFAFETGTTQIFADDPVIYAGPAYGFTFTANDSNALKNVTVTRNGSELDAPQIIFYPEKVMIGTPPKGQFPAGITTVSVTVSLGGQLDGNYDYVIDIEDTAGQHNVSSNSTENDTTDDHREFSVRVDTKGPVLLVDNPANNVELSGNTINVNGTATDLTTNGLTVWYKIDTVDASGTSAPAKADALAAGWEEAPGGTTWSRNTIPMTSVGEGKRYVHFVGFDKLGHASAAVTTRTIFYDADPPCIQGWSPSGVREIDGSYYARGNYTLHFTAKDSNELASVTVKRTVGGVTDTLSTGAGYTLTVDKSDTDNKFWPVTLELEDPPEGNATYEFILKDTRNKENTLDNLPNTVEGDQHKRITVRVDRTGPNVSVSEPVAGSTITGTTFASNGVATDVGIPEGIKVYYTITNGAGTVTAPATSDDATAAAATWRLITEDSSWNRPSAPTPIDLADFLLTGEGQKRIYFAAYDKLDNHTLVERIFYRDAAVPHIENWISTDIKSSATNLLAQKGFAFTFVAKDTNALDSVTITRDDTDLIADGAEHTDPAGKYTITKTPLDVYDQEWRYVASFSEQLDNNYVYHIDIKDIAGKSNTDTNAPGSTSFNYKTFNVRIDTVGPVLSFTSPVDNSTVSGSTITIGGTAVDALTPGGVTVWYIIDGNSVIPDAAKPPLKVTPPVTLPAPFNTWKQTDGSADWYKNAAIDSDNSGEGNRYVHAVAYDVLGNRSLTIEHKPFYVDISPPAIGGFSFVDVDTVTGVNFARKAYGFTFTAKDSNALQSVKVSRDGTDLFTATGAVSDGIGAGTGCAYTVTPNGANTEWLVAVNFVDQSDDNYAFTIEVKDITGKENALDNSTSSNADDDYKTFGVRVDTTGPILTVVDPAVNAAASGSRLYISGTAVDDLTNDNILVYYIIDNGANTSAPVDLANAIATWKLAPGGAYWSQNAELVAGGEGYRYLHVVAYDKRGNASAKADQPFFVDVNPPQITNWDLSTAMGVNFSSTPYYAGENYTLKFDAFDSNTLAGGNPADSQSLVTITRNGETLVEGTQTGYTLTIDRTFPKTWPVTLALADQTDGNYTYAIEIRDATGKENTLDNNTTPTDDDRKSFTIVVDSTPPTTSLTMAPATVSNAGMGFVLANPTLARSDNVNGVIEFAASAMDASGLEGVKWFIIPDSGLTTFNLSAATAKALYDDVRGTLFTANTYTVMYDTSDLTDQTHYSLFILAKDKAGNVGYNNTSSFTFYADQRTDNPVIALTNLSRAALADPDPVVGTGFILRGTVKDDDGLDTTTLKINLSNGTDYFDGSDWTSSSAVDLSPTTITGSGREISFTYNFPSMGIGQDGPNKEVTVKMSDLPSSKVGAGITGYDTANGAREGSLTTTFDLDTAKPVIFVTQPVDTTYRAEAASIGGTLTEMHPDVFRLNIDGGEYVNHIADPDSTAGDLVLTSWNDTTGVGTWTYKLPITTAPLEVGLHTITLEAVDRAGLSTTFLWRFYVDNSGPFISFRIDEIPYPVWTSPPSGMNILREGGLALRGDFRDDFSSVDTASFEYRFDNQSAWLTTDSTTASIANPGRNPSWTLFLENLPAPISGVMPDGPHRVQLRVKDVLGNTTEMDFWAGFRVDTADPTIKDLSPPEADAVYGNGSDPVFTLTGTVEDANLASITLSLNGGAAIPVTVPSGADSVTFNHAVTAEVFGPLGPDSSNRFTITAVDAAGRSKVVEWNFIKDIAAPTIEWSNLNGQTEDNSSLFQDSSNLKILGVARDANGVHTLTSSLEKWDNVTSAFVVIAAETDFDLVPGDETVKNWVKDIEPVGVTPKDGRYRITINATDRGGNIAAASSREFRVDLAMPAVSIDTDSGDHPLQNFYNGKGNVAVPIGTGPIVVTGIATDANGIKTVTATLSGSGAPPWATAIATHYPSTGIWQLTIPHENPDDPTQKLPQGSYTLTVVATDGANRVNSAYGTFQFDSVDPLAVINLPVKYARVTGAVDIRGSNNDTGSGVVKMEYQFTKDGTWLPVSINPNTGSGEGSYGGVWTGGLYSWSYAFASTSVIGESYGTEVSYDPGTGTTTPTSNTHLWEVPFKIRVTDQAGNEKSINDYFLLLDELGDIPRVEITNPVSGSILGGKVYISGTAADNEVINRIEYRVKKNPSLSSNEWDGINWVSGSFLTSNLAALVTWQFDINGNGDLNPASGEGMRPVLVQVRAFDAPLTEPTSTAGQASDPVSILIYFDAGVPRIGPERVANNVSSSFAAPLDTTNSVVYVDRMQVSKRFVFEAELQDDSGLESIEYWLDGVTSNNVIGTSEVTAPPVISGGSFTADKKYMIADAGSDPAAWIAIGAPSGTHGATFTATGAGVAGMGTAYEANGSQEFVYKLRITVPSDTLDKYMNKTGNFTINIMARDNSSPQLRADRSYTLQIDNFYPLGAYTSPNVAAGWYNFRGTARDFDAYSGPIQGLDKVVVYFSRGGTYIPLKEPGSTVGNDGTHLWSGTTLDVRDGATQMPAQVTFPADMYSGITIDRDEQGAGFDQDGDGYEEAWYDNGADKVWSARFNTLQLKDGPITVHYVIFDKAGNATYYAYTVFIKNHAPFITSVTLGTDIFGDKTIGGTRSYYTNYFTNPAFVARNQRLQFNVAKTDGNGTAHYRISNVTRQSVAAATIVAGDIYTINTTGSTDWVSIGAANGLPGTTFVATSNGNGDGTAFKYDTVSGPPVKTGDVAGNETGAVLFSGDDFTGTPGIPDGDNAYFLIKIWDSTVSGGPENQQLSDMVVVRVKIENSDTIVPTARLYDLSPYAKNQSRYDIATTLSNAGPGGIGEDQNMRFGGLYMANSNTISGHVEPRGNGQGDSIFLENGVTTTFAKDTVSGKVLLRGYARDNQRISEIQLKFGTVAPITIIQTDATPATISAGHFRALEPVSTTGVRAWVYDDLSLDEHLVEWAYEWDTQATAGMAVVGDITVQAIARDAKVGDYGATPYTLASNSSLTLNQSQTDNLDYNTIGMTAAPYVTSLTRNVSFNTQRSKQGWNSFRRSSGTETLEANEQVVVNGFNLSLGSSGASVTVKDATTTLTTQAVDRVTLNLPNNAQSGAFVLTVNSVVMVNNRNNNENTWNKEASPTVEGSALWNDDRNVHVWQTNNTSTGTTNTANRGYFTGSGKPIHPAMTKHPITGVLYASWSNYAAAKAYWGTNNAATSSEEATATTPGYVLGSYDPPEHTDIHFGLNGAVANTSPTVAYNNNSVGGSPTNLSWSVTGSGGSYVYDSQAGSVYNSSGKGYLVEGLYHDKMLAQFENQRVVTRGNDIHATYYDTDTKSLKYWYNGRGTNVSSDQYSSNTSVAIPTGGTSRPNNRWMNLDGGFDGHDISEVDRVLGRTGGGTPGGVTNVTGNRDKAITGDVGSSSQAGEFSAIDVTSDGYPVIAYYDATNQTVKLAYANAVVALTTENWKRQNVMTAGDPNYTFSGKYISMRIDTRANKQNRIHMVFYRNSSGDLIYVTGTQAAAGGAYCFETSVIIDSVGNVGKWADISLDAYGNPWVSYADSSWFDSFDAVKMAYCLTSTSTTGAVNVTATGLLNPDKWEVMNMPTIYNVADKRISIENWDTAGVQTGTQFWSAAIGYASDDFFRIGYYIKP